MQLLERDSFIHELDGLLKEAVAGQGRVALVSGEAGIGKTALVEHFTRALQDSVRVLWGTCDSLFTPRPLGPLHDIAMEVEGKLSALLNSNGDRQAIFSACLAELQRRPTIVIFDDVHWADEATLDLIKFICRRVQRTATLFILTYRDDELGSEHPLRLVLGDLPGTVTTRFKLLPLSQSAVLLLASAADQAKQANELFEITGGNPFFVTEALASKGRGVPPTVRDAVLARAARLSPSARTTLEAAAVIGFHVEPWLLTNIVGADSKNVEECIAGGMLQFQADDYAFRHELARQAVLDAISPERKLTLHRMILSVLQGSPETRNDLARLANHAEGPKDSSAVLEYASAAARQAAVASSHREAVRLYESALRFADTLPPETHAQMLDDYLVELIFMDRVHDEIAVRQKAIRLWHSLDDPLKEGADLALLATSYLNVRQRTESDEAIQRAVALLEALPPSDELAQAYMRQCYLKMMVRDWGEAVAWGEQAVVLAERFEDAQTLARTYNYMGCAALIADYERGSNLFERSLTIARAQNLPFSVAGTLTNFAGMLLEVYEVHAANRYLTEGLAYSAEHDDDYHTLILQAWQVLAFLYQGRWAEANDAASKLLQIPNLSVVPRTGALLALGRVRVRQGDSNAHSILDKALELSLEAGGLPRLDSPWAARAEIAWLSGDEARAIAEARPGYDIALSKKHPWVAGELAYWLWRAGENISPPSWIAKPFALSIAGDWRGAANEWEERGCLYEQALALIDGDGPAQLAAFEIFDRLNARPMLERLEGQMRAAGIRIPHAHRPSTEPESTRDEKERFGGLTTRERETAALIAQGKSNREIAEVMVVGVRTVETYVTRILNKLGFVSRVQIATWAVEKGLVPSNKNPTNL
jgi:DNA-binding CsgD family transcriptional regulator/tetratricopeptide (TPR) repeat protein